MRTDANFRTMRVQAGAVTSTYETRCGRNTKSIPSSLITKRKRVAQSDVITTRSTKIGMLRRAETLRVGGIRNTRALSSTYALVVSSLQRK